MKGLYALVGMKHRGSEELVRSLPRGEPLTLVREPKNDFDPNAIQVWAKGRHVGFVRATQARSLARKMDAAAPGSFPAKLVISADRWPMIEVDE